MHEFKYKSDNDHFDSIEEFVDNLSRGGEVEFFYKEKKYGITHPCGKPFFYEAYNEASERTFDSIEELLTHKIDGERICDIVTLIQPFFRCF